MSAKRATIGRTFKQSTFSEEKEEQKNTQTFTLASGKKVDFTLQIVPTSDIAELTYVDQTINGRDQNALTPESLKDITKTIKLQQFFPCIGVQIGNRIEILDGSRRRAAAILSQTPLKVMVTKTTITSDDARQLAHDIQTAKEHNIREIGLRLLTLKNAGLNQKEIAEKEGISQAKVTRALQAASVSSIILSIFPVQSELKFNDYKALANIEDLLNSKGIETDFLIQHIRDDVNTIKSMPGLVEDEVNQLILNAIKKASSMLAAVSHPEKAMVSPLCHFQDKDKFARKRVKGRMFSYEFNRLSKQVQDDLDSAILSILSKYQ